MRAHLARGDVAAAEEWSDRVGAVLQTRAIPSTLPAIGHGRALTLLARGEFSAAHQALESARESWRTRRRFWEGTWTLLDLAAAAAKARRRGAAASFLAETRTIATAASATTLADEAERLARSFDPVRPVDPWHPLSEREFTRSPSLWRPASPTGSIAQELVVAPKTVSGTRDAHPHETGCRAPGRDRRVVHNHPA